MKGRHNRRRAQSQSTSAVNSFRSEYLRSLATSSTEQRTKGEKPAFFPLTRASHSISSKYPLMIETEVVDDKEAAGARSCSNMFCPSRSGKVFWPALLMPDFFPSGFYKLTLTCSAEKTTKPPNPQDSQECRWTQHTKRIGPRHRFP